MSPRRRLVDLVARVLCAAGVPAVLRRRRHRRQDFRVYILEYHDFCATDAEEREGVVSAPRLERHLRHLTRHYHPATVAQAADALDTGLDQDLVVVTCDDGYATNHDLAWPVLQKLEVPATIYVTTGFIDGEPLWFDFARRAFAALQQIPERLPSAGRAVVERVLGVVLEGPEGSLPAPGPAVRCLKAASGVDRRAVLEVLASLDLDLAPAQVPLTWDQVKTLGTSGLEIGAHTVSHPILSRIPVEEQEHEIVGSRQRIAEATGLEPTTFAFPNGSQDDFEPATVEILRRHGFRANCTTIRGSNPSGCDRLTLKRLGVGSDSNALLTTRLSGVFDEGLRRLLPKTLRDSPMASPQGAR